MARICCPEGYHYIGGSDPDHACCPDGLSGASCTIRNTVPTVPCDPSTCCPIGYAYINSDGTFLVPGGGTMPIGNPDITPFVGHCCIITNLGSGHPWAILPTVDPPIVPIDCPCCPVGYTYISLSGLCSSTTRKTDVQSIPCVTVCPDPPQFPCPSCQENGGTHISFTWDDTTKRCTDCKDTGEPTGLGGEYNSLLPIQIADPIINFKRQ